MRLGGDKVAARPGTDGVVETAEIVIVPVKPELSNVIAEVADPPAMKLDGTGAATVGLKSGATMKVKDTE